MFGGLDRLCRPRSLKPRHARMAAARHRERHRAPVGLPRSAFFFSGELTPASSVFFLSCVAVAEPGAPAKVNCWGPTDIELEGGAHRDRGVDGWAVVIYGAKKTWRWGKKEEAK